MYEKFGQFIDGKWQQSEKKETSTLRGCEVLAAGQGVSHACRSGFPRHQLHSLYMDGDSDASALLGQKRWLKVDDSDAWVLATVVEHHQKGKHIRQPQRDHRRR